jgi:hypothetical protein
LRAEKRDADSAHDLPVNRYDGEQSFSMQLIGLLEYLAKGVPSCHDGNQIRLRMDFWLKEEIACDNIDADSLPDSSYELLVILFNGFQTR